MPRPARCCHRSRKRRPRKRRRRSRNRRRSTSLSFHAAPAWARHISTAALTALVGVHVVAAQQQPPLSLTTATTTALQQVSAFQQAQIDEALAAEDLRQARAALLPRARDSFSITYNTA